MHRIAGGAGGLLLVLIAVLASAPAARGGPAAPTATPAPCPPAWRLVAGPNPTWRSNRFYALAVVNTNDVWAVGSASGRPLAAHWNGSAWRVVPVPNLGLHEVILRGATAVGSHDVWAVGSGYSDRGSEETLALHWDGNIWRRVPTPSPARDYNFLSSVTALGPDDIWAVGSAALIAHWDGRQWSRVPAPATVAGPLTAVAGAAAGDVWAVGASVAGDPLALHWDGMVWSEIPPPRTSTGTYDLGGVAVIAADDVWAVGTYWPGAGSPREALTAHWNGATWSIIPAPSGAPSHEAHLYAVAAPAANDVWAAGDAGFAGTLTLHWNGSAWSRVPSPSLDPLDVAPLFAVAAGDSGELWAAGGQMLDIRMRTLVLHYSAGCDAPAPPPAGCTLPFTDVAPGHPFYSNIQCLYCFNIVDGYSDGTFRAGAIITRGQVAKLFANLGYIYPLIPPGRQTFTDVPPSHPFYLFIEEAYSAGWISGYSDGTFRPGNEVTRGQMAKFVAQAVPYSDSIPPTQQSFADVPPADPFWLFVERARAHGVIGGYSDGTFRPGAPVARGQAAKFISNAFFPDCGPLR